MDTDGPLFGASNPFCAWSTWLPRPGYYLIWASKAQPQEQPTFRITKTAPRCQRGCVGCRSTAQIRPSLKFVFFPRRRLPGEWVSQKIRKGLSGISACSVLGCIYRLQNGFLETASFLDGKGSKSGSGKPATTTRSSIWKRTHPPATTTTEPRAPTQEHALDNTWRATLQPASRGSPWILQH